LGGLAPAPPGTGPLPLALPVAGVHGHHPDIEDLLNRDLDRGLVGVRTDQERVPVLVQQAVALLGDDRRNDDVPRICDGGHQLSSPFPVRLARWQNCSRAARVNTTSSLTSTS